MNYTEAQQLHVGDEVFSNCHGNGSIVAAESEGPVIQYPHARVKYGFSQLAPCGKYTEEVSRGHRVIVEKRKGRR